MKKKSLMIVLDNSIIKNNKGDLIKIIDKKYFNKSFQEFYITSINSGDIKAWKKHTKTNLYLMVIGGRIKLVTRVKKQFNAQIIKKNYLNIFKIEKNTLFGFKGLSKYKSNILVISDLHHNENEVINFPLGRYNYKW